MPSAEASPRLTGGARNNRTIDSVPVLKRCRALGLEPATLGRSRQSTRQLRRTNRKVSEYGLQLKEKQKAKFIYGVL